ncbi:hypothetical protein GYO_3598 [Bacillus spizizenii TU-B-10]|uniref:Uncharacterized protein n=1 Tax=Bacillus spizizenii (strain DSM 15029 / JCM 12233 / NBRC 101239 / NRRL B-23049 / TU-B-10) TaxID=1052585 RepID=G4P0J5_BACS4|nr:hypothetical protein GYO_3598 [Bacillus spizizenii TU-B-10]
MRFKSIVINASDSIFSHLIGHISLIVAENNDFENHFQLVFWT